MKLTKFIQVETKNSGKTAYIEKEKAHYDTMLQVLLYFLGKFNKHTSEQIY